MQHTVEIELAAELTLRARDVPKLDHRVPALAARLAAFDGLLERFHPHMTWGEQAPSTLIHHHLFFDVDVVLKNERWVLSFRMRTNLHLNAPM